MRLLHLAAKPAKSVLRAGMALVLLGLSPAVGRADVIIGNLGAQDGGSITLNSSELFAGSFTMGSQAFSLSDARIRLTFSPAFSTTFRLESDSTGSSQPSGAVLLTFDNPTFFSGNLTYTFTAGTPFTLAANTTYWLVGSTTTGASANWLESSPPTNPTGSGADFGNYMFSANAGATWNNALISSKTLFELNGTPLTGVPEPSSLVLVGMVVCVAAAVGWRRRRTCRPELAVVTAGPADGK